MLILLVMDHALRTAGLETPASRFANLVFLSSQCSSLSWMKVNASQGMLSQFLSVLPSREK